MRLGDVQVDGRRLQTLVAQPLLDVTDVNAMLQQGGCIGVPQGMAAHMFGNASPLNGTAEHLRRPGLATGLTGLVLEQVRTGMILTQVPRHHLLHVPGKRNIAVLATLPFPDVDLAAVKVKVIYGYVQRLTFPHTRVEQQPDERLLAKLHTGP